MCFSAPVSFIASGSLSAIGIASLKKLKTSVNKQSIPLATMPFIFSLQQLSEGFVWVTLGNSIQLYFSMFFMFFSHFFWPTYVPIAFYMYETKEANKKILKYFIPIGLLSSLHIGYFLVLNGFTLVPSEHHLTYRFDIPFVKVAMATYLIATILPSAFSSSKTLKFFSFTIAAAYLLSFLAFKSALISVWCFFSAILSSIIFYHFRTLKQEAQEENLDEIHKALSQEQFSQA